MSPICFFGGGSGETEARGIPGPQPGRRKRQEVVRPEVGDRDKFRHGHELEIRDLRKG
jgi:hypothetical protein